MATLPQSPYLPRLGYVRSQMQAANVDAFVVTHLPNIRYLTGFSGSAGVLLLTARRCTLLVDFRYAAAARSTIGSEPELAAATNVVVPPRSYDEALLELLAGTGVRRIGVEAAWMTVSRFNWLSTALAHAAPTPLESDVPCPVLVATERLVETSRVIKDAGEVATFREAGRRLAGIASRIDEFVRPGRSELAVAADIDAALRRGGFERPAFETIVASGPNSARPHARPGPRAMQDGDWVVLDFGGVYDGYCVDLSRTVQIGAVRPDFRRIRDAVSQAQAAVIAAARPGAAASQLDAIARQVLGQHGLADAFGHGTGHGLGLEVHEEPRIGRPVAGRPDATLAPGMVFTVEPGAYLEGIGGVRIEDDVLVTDKGCDVLTQVSE